MPSMVVVCTSCPQAWVTPWFFDANSRPVSSMMGRASMSPAEGGGDGAFADIHGQAGAFEAARLQAGSLKPLRQPVRGAELLEGQLRVRMQVTAESDQLRQEGLQPRPHQSGGLSFSSVVAH